MAAVATVNDHYPSLHLERRIIKKMWHTVSSVKCRTKVLDGLSSQDFYLAMLIDVEVDRPKVKELLLVPFDN
jgi:pterin-4a-carbinolamine dehydratase